MSGLTSWSRIGVLLAGVAAGCGGADRGGESGPATAKPGGLSKQVILVGFDASEPIVKAMTHGKIQGVVVQNPLKMGELGVKTLVMHLEKQPVEPKVPTGEMLITPENMKNPEVQPLIDPPKVENVSGGLSGAKTKKWRVMVIPKGTTHEFWKTIHAGVKKAEDELGNVEVVWQGPQKEDDRVQQIQLVQSAVAAGVDGIVLAPLDARALVQPVEAAVAKGIPVVIFDSALESTKPVSFVATDNYHGGELAAQRLGQLLQGKGKIILLRYAVGSESTEKREKGFTDTMAKEFPGITFLSESEYAGPTAGFRPAEGAEPGDPISGAGRRHLLSQREQYRRHASRPRGGWHGRGSAVM